MLLVLFVCRSPSRSCQCGVWHRPSGRRCDCEASQDTPYLFYRKYSHSTTHSHIQLPILQEAVPGGMIKKEPLTQLCHFLTLIMFRLLVCLLFVYSLFTLFKKWNMSSIIPFHFKKFHTFAYLANYFGEWTFKSRCSDPEQTWRLPRYAWWW